MATATRPYVVVENETQVERLVQATNQSQARNFVARSQYSVKAASANDVIDMMAKGIKPEMATDEKAE
jgi:hypothetical protein